MIKVNLYVGRKPFQLPVIAGIDLGALSFKGLGVAFFISLLPGFLLDSSQQEEIEQANNKVSTVQLQLAKLKKEEKSYGSVREEIEALKKQEEKLAEKLVVVRKIIKQKRNPMKIMLYIAQNIPDDVWLKKLEITDSTLTIIGESKTYTSIGVFIENLRSSVFFNRDVNLKSSQTTTDEKEKRRIESFEVVGNIKIFG